MAWFKVDDGFYSSRKVLMIPRAMRFECIGVWVMAGTWSAKELTDGHIPEYILEEFGSIPEIRDELIRVGLWVSDGAEGAHFHDWDQYQPTREQVLEKRENTQKARSEAGKRGMASRWDNKGITNEQAPDNKLITPTRPDPTIPKGIGKRAARISPTFEVTKSMTEWALAKKYTLDLSAETEKFVDYYLAEAGTKGVKLDWVATWRNWITRAQGWSKENNRDVDPWAGKEHLGFDA